MSVVITSLGAVSALGVGHRALWDGLAANTSGVRPISTFDASGLSTKVAAEVEGAADAAFIEAPSGRHDVVDALAARGALVDRKVGFAIVAAHEALQGTGARIEGLRIGLGLERARLADFVHLQDGVGRGTPSSRVTFRVPADEAARALCARFDIPNNVAINLSACAAGTLALTDAARAIARGEARALLVGAADAMVNPLGVGGMERLGAPSPRAAADACRPFDRRRDGLVIGEGAAFFVVEREDDARARGATIFARIRGAASTQDAYGATAPRPDASRQALAMQRAMARAGVAPDEVGYVCAHGTGTPLNDPSEARAMHLALGEHAAHVPTSSIKGAIGHTMAAAGALEIAAALMAFSRGLIPPTAHHTELDPACELNIVAGAPLRAQPAVILKSSFGFGGQNAAIVLGAPL